MGPVNRAPRPVSTVHMKILEGPTRRRFAEFSEGNLWRFLNRHTTSDIISDCTDYANESIVLPVRYELDCKYSYK
jgi:hypothetical protein